MPFDKKDGEFVLEVGLAQALHERVCIQQGLSSKSLPAAASSPLGMFLLARAFLHKLTSQESREAPAKQLQTPVLDMLLIAQSLYDSSA